MRRSRSRGWEIKQSEANESGQTSWGAGGGSLRGAAFIFVYEILMQPKNVGTRRTGWIDPEMKPRRAGDSQLPPGGRSSGGPTSYLLPRLACLTPDIPGVPHLASLSGAESRPSSEAHRCQCPGSSGPPPSLSFRSRQITNGCKTTPEPAAPEHHVAVGTKEAVPNPLRGAAVQSERTRQTGREGGLGQQRRTRAGAKRLEDKRRRRRPFQSVCAVGERRHSGRFRS